MNTPVQIVFVDFDDTLVDTAPRFSRARRELFQLIAEAGYSEEEAERIHHHEIDPDMREKFGFGPHRLEHTFRETYERLRAKAGHDADDVMAERCASLGRLVAGTPPAFDGALDALRELANTFPTVLYTQSGDQPYQMGCVRGAGILEILPEDRVRITSLKCREDFEAALAHYGVTDPDGAWMIGNSMRSDVNPALEAGANAILVDVEDPWHYDMVEPSAAHFHRAASFLDAVALLRRLAG